MTTLYHQRWIAAPSSGVYDAIAQVENIGRWWAPHTAAQTPEGLVISHDPGPAHGPVRFRVIAAVANQRVHWEVISSHPRTSPASAWTGTRVQFELSERASPGARLGMAEDEQRYTVLDFQHAGWDEKSEYIGFCNSAWGEVLGSLKRVCEGSR